MTTLVSIDTKTGELQRYVRMQDCEIARTHHGVVAEADFRWAAVEEFRRTPPISCVLKPPQIILEGGHKPLSGSAA